MRSVLPLSISRLSIILAASLASTYGFAAEGPSILKSCPLTHKIQQVGNVADLSRSLCALRDTLESFKPIASQMKSTLAVLAKFDPPMKMSDLLKTNPSVGVALNQIAVALTQAQSGRPFGQAETHDALAAGISSFIEKFGDRSYRSTHPDDFRRAAENVLRKTLTGGPLVRCMDEMRADPIHFQGPDFHYVSGGSDSGFQMMTNFGNSSGKKAIAFDFKPELDPVLALMVFAHEMSHACEALHPLKEERSPGLSTQQTLDQHIFMSEMFAHRVQYQVFQELAADAPSLVCSRSYVSAKFGGQIVTASDDAYDLEASFNAGYFPLSMAWRYSKDMFALSSIVTNPDVGKTDLLLLKLRPEIELRLRAAEFRIPQ